MPAASPGRITNSETQFSTPIRVLLARGLPSAEVTALTGSVFYSYDDSTNWMPAGKSALIHLVDKRGRKSISVNGEDSFSPSVYLRLGSSGGQMLFQGEKHKGSLRFLVDQGTLVVVNKLQIENYLVGVLASEMGNAWPVEALKAQAVAARSYAHFRLKTPKSRFYDIESTVEDQAFRGWPDKTDRLESAVNGTRGLVLFDGNSVARCLYHSRCGGKTEKATFVWVNGKKTNDESADCPGCRERRVAWQATAPLSLILKKVGLVSTTGTKGVAIKEMTRGVSGRVAELNIFANGKHRSISSDQLRGIVGYHKMKSAYFDWRIEDKDIVFDGFGAGHGVGLCQWGAKYFADKGISFTAILKHYYPAKRLARIAAPSPAIARSEPPLSRPIDSRPSSDVLLNRTSFQSVFSSASTRRLRLSSNR